MENAVMTREEVTEARLCEYLNAAGVGRNITEGERRMFINIARTYSLDPFKREIYITAFGEGERRQVSIITGYEVYIKRAERTGLLDGWKCWTEGEGENMKAVIEIYRKDWKFPFTHEALYKEACQYTYDKQTHSQRPNRTWAKMPGFMLKKSVIGQGFRLCFADEIGGIPYDSSEVAGEAEPRNVTETGTAALAAAAFQDDNPAAPAEASPEGEAQAARHDLLVQIGDTMKAEDADGNPYFTEDDIASVREKCRTFGDTSADVEALRGILKQQQEALAKRE